MNKKIKFITQSAMIAALYVVLTYVFAPFSFGPVQVRLAEALTVLPVFTPAAIPGLFIGCILGNIVGGAIVWDIVFGSVATLIGAVLTYLLRKKISYLAVLPPILSNTLIIPFILYYAYGFTESSVPFMILAVGAGEVLSCGVLGVLLYFALRKVKSKIFKV